MIRPCHCIHCDAGCAGLCMQAAVLRDPPECRSVAASKFALQTEHITLASDFGDYYLSDRQAVGPHVFTGWADACL